MRRRLAIAGLTLLAIGLLLPCPSADAHGGQYVPPPPTPGGAAPPGMPRANTPTEVGPGVGGPIVTPGGGLLRVGPVGRRTPAFTPTYAGDWQRWWDLHRDLFLPPKPGVHARGVVTPSGEPAAGGRAAWEAERDRWAREEVVPVLMGLLAPGHGIPDDVRASAAIALGRLADQPVAIEPLLGWLERADAPDLVREGAALGLGLLRRTDPARRLSAGHLDPLRFRLLAVFDAVLAGRKVTAPRRTRQLAMLSLGVLGDQPFGQDERSKDGALLSELLWQRMEGGTYRTTDYRIAVLNALGRQPRAGLGADAHTGLRALAAGKRLGRRRHPPGIDAHALAALLGLEGARGLTTTLEALQTERTSAGALGRRLAAALAVGEVAGRLPSSHRLLLVRVLEEALATDQQVLVMGLLTVALGRVLAADFADGSLRVFEGTRAAARLEQRAAKGPWYLRGWGVLGMALAAREAPRDDPKAQRWRTEVAQRLLATLRDRALEPGLRGAAAVGLGLLGTEAAIPDLRAVAARETYPDDLRANAALALGQIGRHEAGVETTLATLATTEGPERLRADAALALSLVGVEGATGALVAQLRAGGRTAHLAGVTIALGHLGDLAAVEPLLATAVDPESPELVRAMALVALGLLLDPEERPSLLRLKRGTPYPLGTMALEEAFSIL